MLTLGLIAALVLAGAWRAGWLDLPSARQRGARHKTPSDAEADGRALLGVGPHATADEIRAAHRRMVAECHPDRGGSAVRTQALNDARHLLLQCSD